MERARDHIQIIVDSFVMRGFRLRAIATAVTAALRWGGLVEKKKPFNHLSRSYKNDLRSLVRGREAVKLSRLGGIEGVAANLNTDLRMGIGSATSMQMSDRDKLVQEAELNKQLAERKYVFGVNTHTLNCIQESRRVLIWQTFKRNCWRRASIQNVYILCGVILLALAITNRHLELSIGLIILMVTIIKAGTKMGIDFCLSNRLQNLALQRAEDRMKARVIRCGRSFHVSTCEIVVGDLVELCCGDRVPADGLAVESNSLGVNMEGTNQTTCSSDSAFLTSGSIMQSKSGRLMLVTAVGKDTQWTGQYSSLSTGSDMSCENSTRKIDHDFLTQFRTSEDVLERLMLYVTLLHLIVLSLSYFTHLRVADLDPISKLAVVRDFYGLRIRVVDLDSRKAHDIATAVIHYLVYDFYDKLTFLLTLAPFNLFSAASLALFYFIPRVSADGACIMKIQRCCTKLGSITTICTGKAGLLTAAKMEVKSSWIAGDLREHEDHETLLLSAMPEEIGRLLLQALVLNSDSRSASSEEFSCGNRTEKALLRWAHQEGVGFDAIRQRYTVLKVEPFDSDRRQSGAFVQRREGDGSCIVHWKGAAEIILPFCNRLVCRDAESSGINIRALLDDDRSDIEAKIANMEHNGLRCVAFAYKMGRAQTASGSMQLLAHISLEKRDLILLAVVGMKETLMSGVPENVRKARNAGLRVIMVTGDSVEAARAMAKECGIIQAESNNIEHDQIVDGSTFRAWSPRNRQQRLQRLTVLARASGHDKQLLVASLQANDEVVAVTGHKHRDIDVLQMADVGFSLGGGERVAMENSDIIITLQLDDTLASLLKAVKWGRCVRCNLQYFIQFVHSMSAVAPLISQLSGTQFQWIDLITVLATIAVIMQPPQPSLMLQPPLPQNLYTNVMVRNIVLQVIYQVILFVVIIQYDDDQERQRTIVFNSFIFCQLINIVNTRQRHIFQSLLLHVTDYSSQQGGLLKKVKSFLRECRTSILENNLLSLATITVIVIVQYLLIRFGGSKISSIPLGWHDWLFCLSLAGGSWVVAVLGEFLPMPTTPRFDDANFFV